MVGAESSSGARGPRKTLDAGAPRRLTSRDSFLQIRSKRPDVQDRRAAPQVAARRVRSHGASVRRRAPSRGRESARPPGAPRGRRGSQHVIVRTWGRLNEPKEAALRGRVRDARGRAPLRGRGRERDRPEGRRVERAGQGPQRRRRPARPAAGARVGSRRPDQGDPPPHHQPAALQGRARAHLRRGPVAGPAGLGPRAQRRRGLHRADPQLRRPGLLGRQPARHRRRRGLQPLHPDDQQERRRGLHHLRQGRRPGGGADHARLAGHGRLRQRPGRPDRAVGLAGQPLGAVGVLERRQQDVRVRLQDLEPGHGGLVGLRLPGPEFPDYPHYGVWADAYYVGTNE